MDLCEKRITQFQPDKIKPKNAYQFWFIKLGGFNSYNRLPRGKKFNQSVKGLSCRQFYSIERFKRPNNSTVLVS